MHADPFAMYYVVRKDVPLSLGRAMAMAGAAAVTCTREFEGDPRFADAFRGWRERPRKVALRATAEEIGELRSLLPGALVADTVLCLPPMRKSERPPLLEALRPFTDGPRPKEPPESQPRPLVYVVRPGVIKTAGKAMAQAGHAAVAFAELHEDSVEAWRADGYPGEVRAAGDEAWERIRALPAAAVVTDAGHTQVAPGTETVVALPPIEESWAAAAALDVVP